MCRAAGTEAFTNNYPPPHLLDEKKDIKMLIKKCYILQVAPNTLDKIRLIIVTETIMKMQVK